MTIGVTMGMVPVVTFFDKGGFVSQGMFLLTHFFGKCGFAELVILNSGRDDAGITVLRRKRVGGAARF